MAKYLIIQDFEVSTKMPNGQSQLVVFPKDNVIDAAISPIDNKLVTTPSGELPNFKSVGQVLVPVDITKVKLIAEPKSDDMKKWLYLGGTALLLWWFIYGRDRKQKYDSTPAGYAGIKNITSVEYFDDGQTLLYGTKNNKTRVSVLGLSKEDIIEEFEFEKKMLQREKMDLQNKINANEEIQKSTIATKNEKKDSEKIVELSKRNIDILETIVLPFYEKWSN